MVFSAFFILSLNLPIRSSWSEPQSAHRVALLKGKTHCFRERSCWVMREWQRGKKKQQQTILIFNSTFVQTMSGQSSVKLVISGLQKSPGSPLKHWFTLAEVIDYLDYKDRQAARQIQTWEWCACTTQSLKKKEKDCASKYGPHLTS